MPDVTHDHLESLDREECLRRLQAQGIGRLGVRRGDTVEILPVNYVVDDDAVVVRVRRGGALDGSTRSGRVALEIDQADSVYHEGWSVLVTGRCTHVTDPEGLRVIRRLALTPWGDDERDLGLRIAIESISGRRIVHRAV